MKFEAFVTQVVAVFLATLSISFAQAAKKTAPNGWSGATAISPVCQPDPTRVAISQDGALTLVGWIDHYHGAVQVSKSKNGVWGAMNTIGKGTAWASFQEVFGLAASATVARAIWKNARTGTQTFSASFGR